MAKVIIIGAGASGLTAAICAKRRGLDVTVLERNDGIAKKILITGNGHCNYWNEDMNLSHYHTSSNVNLQEIITKENQEKVMQFFEKLGVIPKIKNGYFYPYSMQAVSIKAVLLNEIQELNIPVITNTLVKKIEKQAKDFLIYTDNEIFKSDYVIVAMGSKAAPKTGSDGMGYNILNKLGHNIIPVIPSLTQIRGNESYYKDWNGIRIYAELSLYENDIFSKKEYGEIHLTDYGISGICTFNLSGLVAKGLTCHKKEVIYINFLKDLNIFEIAEGIDFLEKRNEMLKERNIDQLFDGFLPYKLVYLFLKLAGISKDTSWDKLTKKQKEKLLSLIIKHKIIAIGVNDFDSSQVCSGGLDLAEVNLQTMESKKVSGLYIAGEILDVDGDCGGYNLGFAWITGLLAGEKVGEK